MNSDRQELDREAQADHLRSVTDAEGVGLGVEGLVHLQEQLRELRQRFDATDAQIADYLREKTGTNHGAEANGEAMAHVQEGIDRLLSQFDEMKSLLLDAQADDLSSGRGQAVGLGSNTRIQDVLDALQKLADYQKELANKIVGTLGKRMSEELDMLRFQQVVHETLTTEWDRREAQAEAKAREEAEAEALSLAESELDIELQEIEEEPESDPSAVVWARAIWGAELTEAEEFQPYLKELNRRLLEEDPSVATLAGQLLVFRHASPEAKPQLLKDVGEAYYRTRVDAADAEHPFERALIRWLQKECDRVGLPNTIEVVHVGERFDKSRHSSTTRGGAEVAEVLGWVVLTEGGRVYTRASVAAH